MLVVLYCSLYASMTEFNVHLLSDTCLAEFPSNSPSDFQVVIPGWSELVGEWEVGVSGFYHPSRNTVKDARDSLYLYSSIVRPILVGNKLEPLLRIIPFHHKQTRVDNTHTEFENIQYVRVQDSSSNVIHVIVRDEKNEPIRFPSKKVIVSLRFRPVKMID